MAAVLLFVLSKQCFGCSSSFTNNPFQCVQISNESRLLRKRTLASMAQQMDEKSQLLNTIKSGNDFVSIIATTTISDRASISIVHINALMLLFYCTLGSAHPFIPIFYRKMGISDSVIGLLGAITPAVTFLVSPIWGALADAQGNHIKIMLITFVISILSRCLLATGFTNVFFLSFVVAITAVFNAPVKPLMDNAVMSLMPNKKDYGRTRLFGQLGFGLGSFLVGPFMNSNILSIFPLQAAFAVPTAIVMSFFLPVFHNKKTLSSAEAASLKPASVKARMPLRAEKPDSDDFRTAITKVLTQPDILIFFTFVFLVGISSGIIENFGYVRLAEIGADKTANCLGICRLVSSFAGAPMFWYSGEIIQRIGVTRVMCWSVFVYFMRFFIYASVQNPWHALPAEALRGFTFALFWSASTYHVFNKAPDGLGATMVSNPVMHMTATVTSLVVGLVLGFFLFLL